MVAIRLWRPRGLLAHRDPTVRLGSAPSGGPPVRPGEPARVEAT
jgi:hypothetical protein